MVINSTYRTLKMNLSILASFMNGFYEAEHKKEPSMKLRETFDTGEGMTPGYVVILTHDNTYLCREKTGLRRFIVFIKGESNYFNDFFKAVYAFREEIGQ